MKFSELCDITADLVRCVIDDKEKASNTLNFVTQWVKKLRLKEEVYPSFIDIKSVNLNNGNKSDFIADDDQFNVMPATTKFSSPTNCKKRLMSSIERSKKPNKKTFAKKYNEFVSDIHPDSINESLLPSKAQGRRRCGLCAEKGHCQYSCKRIKSDVGVYPLSKNDDNTRNSLTKLLVVCDPMGTRFVSYTGRFFLGIVVFYLFCNF